MWQKKAINFCNGECKGEKCGVNSFSVGWICYAQQDKIQETQEITEAEQTLVGQDKIEETLIGKDALICKDSCPLDNKCYPFGYRKADSYCSDSGSFEKQLAGNENCENNFECKTNVCVDGKCISQSTMQKIFSWFRKLFGSE